MLCWNCYGKAPCWVVDGVPHLASLYNSHPSRLPSPRICHAWRQQRSHRPSGVCKHPTLACDGSFSAAERCGHVSKVQTSLRALKDSAATPARLLLPHTHLTETCLWVFSVIIKWQMTLRGAATLKWNVFFKAAGKGSFKRQSRLRKFGRESGNAATQATHTWCVIRKQVHVLVVSHLSFAGIFGVALFFFVFLFICVWVCQTSSWVTSYF